MGYYVGNAFVLFSNQLQRLSRAGMPAEESGDGWIYRHRRGLLKGIHEFHIFYR